MVWSPSASWVAFLWQRTMDAVPIWWIPFFTSFENQFQRLFQIVCGVYIVMMPRVPPQKQHRPDLRAARSHHIGVIGVPNVDSLARCTAADPQGLVKYFPVGLVGPDGIRTDHTRCLQPIVPQGLLHIGESNIRDDIDWDGTPVEKEAGIRKYRGVDPVTSDQTAQCGRLIRQPNLVCHIQNDPVYDLILGKVGIQIAVRLVATPGFQDEPLDLPGVMETAVFADATDDLRQLWTVFVHGGSHVVDKNRFDHIRTSAAQMCQFRSHTPSQTPVFLPCLRCWRITSLSITQHR